MTLKAGRLGTPLDVPTGADQVLYTCNGDSNGANSASASISLCNRGANTVKVRISIASGGAPTDAEYLEYDTEIPPGGVLERSGVVISAGESILIKTDTATVSARAHGFEK